MLLIAIRHVAFAVAVTAFGPASLIAQAAADAELRTHPDRQSITGETSGAVASRVGLSDVHPAGPVWSVRRWRLTSCETLRCVFDDDRATQGDAAARRDRRGLYALTGALVGGGAAWGWFAYHCRRGDCYSPVGGLLLAAGGGALGALVGILIAPTPEP